MDIQKNVSLAKHTTFKVGGAAKFLCTVKTQKDLSDALQFAQEKNLKYFILAGGSNVLFNDKGFDGLVIKINNEKLEINNKNEIICGAGVNLMKLVNFSVENGLTGLEWAAGIPGTVGGAIRGNAGAFGGEIKDLIKNVTIIKTTSAQGGPASGGDYSSSDCQFSYRESIFKQNQNLIVWESVIKLDKGNREKSEEEVKKILEKRRLNQPSLGEFPSAGSVFKNPIGTEETIKAFEKEKGVKAKEGKVPAGWLIDKAGLKGKQIGEALINQLQANFIGNTNNATSQDIQDLINLTKKTIKEKFNIILEEEIQIVNH